MLAIFPKSVAEAPAQLTSQELAPANSVETAMRYEQSFPDAVSLKFSNGTRFLISHSKQSFSNPRYGNYSSNSEIRNRAIIVNFPLCGDMM